MFSEGIEKDRLHKMVQQRISEAVPKKLTKSWLKDNQAAVKKCKIWRMVGVPAALYF